ncbi:TetR/AcrR family transcriptional regulator [Streptomyces formicae]|uniref:TetR/AcrR family transcriptional regulator n=1 Tax=Streptomyces formicae TaxID=1616117 RepID=UPI000BF56D65|nr:TetR/AcrR family transcriptional regulator [Streptomyces formicae]
MVTGAPLAPPAVSPLREDRVNEALLYNLEGTLTQTASRGRPAHIDRFHVRDAALALLKERGFEEVSTAQIAAAVGISRSSLARFYPTKQQIVWEGLDDLSSRLSAQLEQSPEQGSVSARLKASIEAALTLPESELSILRTRLQLVRDNPGLQVKRAHGRDPLAQVVSAFIGSNSRTAYTEGERSCLAALVAAAIDTALIEWSGSDKTQPVSHVDDCLGFIIPIL